MIRTYSHSAIAPVISARLMAALSLVFVVLNVTATFAETTSPALLTIRVENVSTDGGYVQVALYDRASYEGHDRSPVVETTVEAKSPETIVTLPNVRPGEYAVKMFQDVKRSGSFVTSALGLPEEPYGFSNDARPFLDQPKFDVTKFDISPGSKTIVIHLRSAF